jgi:hypothetical protein
LTDTGDDTYTVSGSITCTFTGTIPVIGTLTGTVTCTSTHSLTVDIDTNGSPFEINIGPFSPGWTAGSTATTHDGVGGVTITITTPPQVSATLNTGNFDNNPASALDEFDVAKSVNTIIPDNRDNNPAKHIDYNRWDTTGQRSTLNRHQQ